MNIFASKTEIFESYFLHVPVLEQLYYVDVILCHTEVIFLPAKPLYHGNTTHQCQWFCTAGQCTVHFAKSHQDMLKKCNRIHDA